MPWINHIMFVDLKKKKKCFNLKKSRCWIYLLQTEPNCHNTMLVLVTCVEQEDVVHYIIFYHLIDQQWYLCNSNICIVCGTIKKGSKMYLLDYSTHFFFFFFFQKYGPMRSTRRDFGTQANKFPWPVDLTLRWRHRFFKSGFLGWRNILFS